MSEATIECMVTITGVEYVAMQSEITKLRAEVERCKGLHNETMDGWQETLSFNNQLVTANTTLRAENERLRAALQWYADEDHYFRRISNDWTMKQPLVIVDSGHTARAALGERT